MNFNGKLYSAITIKIFEMCFEIIRAEHMFVFFTSNSKKYFKISFRIKRKR